MTKSGWMQDIAGIIALPGKAQGGAPSPDELRQLLLGKKTATKAHEILNMLPRKRIPAWADFLAEHASREHFMMFAYFPGQVLSGFPPPPEISTVYQWSTLVELYESWSQIVSAGRFEGLDERSIRVSEAYFARTRWLLLSVPFRNGAESRVLTDDLERINDETGRILTLARQARDNWLEALGEIDDYPGLKQDIAIEDEAYEIAVLKITREQLKAVNPGLPLGSSKLASSRDLVGDEVTGYVISRLLLPRFALCRVWRIVYGTAKGWLRRLGIVTAAVCMLTVVALTVGMLDPASTLLRWAPLGAIAWYVLIGIAGIIRPVAAWPWLMRQPASAAVGLLAIAAIPPDWWDSSGKEWHAALWAALLLAATGTGYLYVEAGSQDVRGSRRLWRPLVVAGLGYLHAFMVAVIGLRFLLPEFTQRPASGPRLSCWWQPHGCGPDALPSWLLVLAAASWSFFAAVFLQIIWDDQPVTAPLSHMSWHRKG